MGRMRSQSHSQAQTQSSADSETDGLELQSDMLPFLLDANGPAARIISMAGFEKLVFFRVILGAKAG
jgi:hypothetical protein